MAVPSYFNQTPGLASFYNKGLANHMPPMALAGLAGGFIQESRGLNDAMGDNGNAIGIAQWNDRAPALKAYAQSMGKDWRDPDTQSDFIFNELKTTEGRAYNALLKANTPEEAARAALMYERPNGWNGPDVAHHPTLGWNTRVSEAKRFADSLSGIDTAGPPMAYAMNSAINPMDAAGNAIQNTFGAPGGAQSQSPLAPITLGGETSGEDATWDRLGNIGDGLQAAGAAIMAINNPSGAAVLARLSGPQGKKGWHYKATLPSGMGMIFEGPNGETRVEPMPAGYGGPNQADLPSSVREAQFAKENEWYRDYKDQEWKREHPEDKYDPDSMKMVGMDYLINGNQAALKDVPLKQRTEAIRLAKEQFKADTGTDYDPADLGVRRGAYQELIAESRKFGQMLPPTQAAHDRLMADIKIAKERIADLPAELNSSNLPWNQFMQMTSKALQDAGFAKLAQAREAIYNVERGYSSVQANGMRSGDTVTSQKRAEALINSAMTPDVLLGQVGKDGQRSGGLLDFMGESANRILDNVKGGQKRLREEWKRGTQEFGSKLNESETQITKDIESRAQPGAQAPQAAPDDKQRALEELRRRGVKI